MGLGARWITDSMNPSLRDILKRIRGWFRGEKRKRKLRLKIEDGKWRFTRGKK